MKKYPNTLDLSILDIEPIKGGRIMNIEIWPKVVLCHECGEPMDLISIEKGYVCSNAECPSNQEVEELEWQPSL